MISSSQEKRVVSQEERATDSNVFQNMFRPKTLESYIGQENLKKHLQVSISSAKIRKEPLEHILFYGPPGLGKTTLSSILAYEMESHLRTTS